MFKPGTKKSFLILFFILLFTGIILFVIRLNKQDSSIVEKMLPEIHVVRTDVTGISEEEINLRANVLLENHMPVGVSIDSIAYVIFIIDKEIARSMYAKKIDINANDTSSIELPVSLAFKKLGKLFERLHNEGKDSTLMRMGIKIYSSLITNDSAWVHIKQNIPVIVLPAVRIEKLKIHKLTTSGVLVHISMMVINDNTMRFAFRDSKYKVIFEDHLGLEGVISEIIELPAKDSALITIPLDLNFKDIGQTLADYIRKGKDMKYDVTINTQPVSDIRSIKGSQIILHSAGTIKMIQEAMEVK